MTNAPSPPAALATRLRWVLALTSTAYFMVILDTGALFAALPRMQRDLHAGLASVQWAVNSYGIAFAAGILTAAALGDRFGRRRLFSLGLALFTLSSAACALAPTAAELIAARTVQGLGAAVVLPLSLTILTTAFPPHRRGLIVGIYGGLAGLAVASGPVVGGVVTEGLNWHWIFWLNVPIGIAATTLAAPMLPMRLLRGRAFAVGNVTMFLMSGATLAAAFLVTQEFQIARGYSPVSAGLRLLPFFGTPMVVSPLAGALSDRIGRRAIMVSGLTLQALGFAWVAVRGSLHTSWIELVAALLVAGVGVSMALPTVPTAVLNSVAATEMGKASGVNYMAQRLGGVFAIAIAGAAFSAHGNLTSPTAVTNGFQAALWTCVIFAGLAALSSVAITPRTSVASSDANAANALAAA